MGQLLGTLAGLLWLAAFIREILFLLSTFFFPASLTLKVSLSLAADAVCVIFPCGGVSSLPCESCRHDETYLSFYLLCQRIDTNNANSENDTASTESTEPIQ